MQWKPRDAEAFAHALLAKLPLGEIWSRALGSFPARTMRALAGVMERWAARVGRFLITEAFPPTSFLLLSDWERVLGLPEPCFPAAQTLDERRQAVLEKLQRRPGGQSREYYIGLAQRLGYHEPGPSPYQLKQQAAFQAGKQRRIRIREFRPFMFGVSRLGDPRWRFAPPEMRFTWVVRVPDRRLTWFRFGNSQLGKDPHLSIRRAEDLECVLHKYKPAHTVLIFNYQGSNAMKYQPPFEPGFNGPVAGIHNSNPTAEYQNGNPATGEEGSIPPMEVVAHPMKELVHLIEFSGQTPSHLDLEQVRKAIKWMIDFLIEFSKSGDGVDLYHGNEDGVYLLRSLEAGDNITLTVLTNETTGRTSIKIDAAGGGGGGGSGEANTAANVGDAGVPVFKQKSGVELQFRKIYGTNGAIVSQDGDKIKVEAPGVSSLVTLAPMLSLEEQRAGNASPATLTNAAAWVKRAVNTTIVNQIAGAALSGANQVTLPAGSYRANFASVGFGTGHFRARLQDVTHGVTLCNGIPVDSHTSTNPTVQAMSSSVGQGVFTLEETTVIELQGRNFAGNSEGRIGDSNNIHPEVHIDSWLQIVKEG